MGEGADLGPTGGAVWSDPTEWARRSSASGCIICTSGRPLSVIAETETVWVTADRSAPLPGYVCVVARAHVVEPFELGPAVAATFWREAMLVAEAVAGVIQPIKMNYEIHGNTLPHLHLHLLPRHADDPYVGGPVDPRQGSFERTSAELTALQVAVEQALGCA